jgi:bifunctional non-homologous end joining protein LigD
LAGRAATRSSTTATSRELADLVWVANLAALELHTTMGRAPDTTVPTMVVFDLDPGPPADIATCCRVAVLLREVFDRLELRAFPKTSGSKGLQVYVP